MFYHYRAGIFFIFAQTFAMEDCFLKLESPTNKELVRSKASGVLSLKEISLKAYAKFLRERAPQGKFSEKDLAQFGEATGLSVLYDLNFGDLFDRLLMQSECSAKTSQCPKFFSPVGNCVFVDDCDGNPPCIVCTDSQGNELRVQSPFYMRFIEDGYQSPIISSNGKWMMGWKYSENGSIFKPTDLRLLLAISVPRMGDGKYSSLSIGLDSDLSEIAYSFLNNAILIRTGEEIFKIQIDDFLEKVGNPKSIYIRNDSKKYPNSLYYSVIHVFSSGNIACVGPDKKSIEILDNPAGGDTLSLITTIAIPKISDGALVTHYTRGIAAINKNSADERIYLYQFLGDDAGQKSIIKVPCLENYLFSPNGENLACGTDFRRQVVEIFNCKNLSSPQHISTIETTVRVGPALCAAWIGSEITLSDGLAKKHVISFNVILEAYRAYREKHKKVSSKNIL